MDNFKYEEIYSEETLEMIKNEFYRLKGVAYLDHTGATLYSESQIRAVSEDLCGNLYGNPHALNSSSKLSSDIVDQVRERVLAHFNTDSSQYSVIFTSGATASLKLVGETFPWQHAGSFIYFSESHTSVLGMRELAANKQASITSLKHHEMQEIFEKGKELSFGDTEADCLFVYPAQCNFSGVKYPLSWIKHVKSRGIEEEKIKRWFVMLDAASYVATSKLDLSEVTPDFVCLSFYKMFGFPTGLGALLVHKDSEILKKDYFGGGTVQFANSEKRGHQSRVKLHESFEDGTISFLSIAALRHGFDMLSRLVPGGMADIESHTFRLARHLHHSLDRLRHANGRPVTTLYCDVFFENQSKQGPIVNFNLLRANGTVIGFSEVLHMCNLFDVHVRTGCFCNPGACQRHLGLTNEELSQHLEAGHICGDSIDIVAGKPTGSVRASLGYCSTIRDVEKLLELIRKCFVQSSTSVKPETLSSVTAKSGVPRLCRLFLYPVKSCGAQDVASWPLDSRGLLGDRAWMIATDAGVALTQKVEPRMCLVKPELNLSTGVLELSFPGMTNISVPHIPPPEDSPGQSKVCGARVQTSDCGDEVADWLSVALERSGLRLLRQWPTDERTQRKSSAGLSLANQAQFLLVGLGSLAWLEEKVRQRQLENQEEEGEVVCEGEELLSRFRSNLVVSGASEFAETKWKAIKIGSIFLKAEGPCTRCQMVCISQRSGQKTTEPLRTLTASNSEGRMQFGTYFSKSMSENFSHTLFVGSPVTPIELTEQL